MLLSLNYLNEEWKKLSLSMFTRSKIQTKEKKKLKCFLVIFILTLKAICFQYWKIKDILQPAMKYLPHCFVFSNLKWWNALSCFSNKKNWKIESTFLNISNFIPDCGGLLPDHDWVFIAVQNPLKAVGSGLIMSTNWFQHKKELLLQNR